MSTAFCPRVLTLGSVKHQAANLLTVTCLAVLAGCLDRDAGGILEQFGPQQIVMDERLHLGDPSGPGAIGRPAVVAPANDGRVWFVSEETESTITVFDSSGAHCCNLGRTGDGPGEFRSIQDLVWIDSLMLAFDARSSRATVLDAAGDAVSERRLGFAVSRFKQGPPGLVLAAGRNGSETTVMPISILDTRTLDVVSVTGAERPGLLDEFYTVWRNADWSPSGEIVSVPAMEYRVETWTVDGELKDVWRRDPEWMPPQTTQIDMTQSRPQHPMVLDVHVDGHGNVWTLIQVNQPDWHEGLGAVRQTPTGEDVVEIHDINRVFGTRIEVLDLANRDVLGSIYTSELFVRFLPDGTAVSYVEDLRGPKVIVWHLELRSSADEGK